MRVEGRVQTSSESGVFTGRMEEFETDTIPAASERAAGRTCTSKAPGSVN
jgi:hypothetical protein